MVVIFAGMMSAGLVVIFAVLALHSGAATDFLLVLCEEDLPGDRKATLEGLT
jgi:hypothetical protein